MRNIDQLIKTLAEDAQQVQPAPHPFMLSLKLMGAAAAYLAVSLAISGLRPDMMQAFDQPWFIVELISLVGLFIATAVGAALLAYPDLYQKRGIAFAPALMLALFLVALFFSWSADQPPAPLPKHTYECTSCIILVSLLPSVWTFYAMRKFASTHSRLAGALALLSAFSIGALWLRLYEVNDSIMHVVLWHYIPMLAIGLLGLWLGKILLKW